MFALLDQPGPRLNASTGGLTARRSRLATERGQTVRNLLTTPLIYSLAVPLVLLDVWVSLYQAIIEADAAAPAIVVRGSWFVVRGSWFVVRGWWFVVRGWWFVVGGSWFVRGWTRGLVRPPHRGSMSAPAFDVRVGRRQSLA